MFRRKPPPSAASQCKANSETGKAAFCGVTPKHKRMTLADHALKSVNDGDWSQAVRSIN
jgi:hypothetical protein